MKNKQYKVYTAAGEYHHVYNSTLEGALDWAIDCAKIVKGSVREVCNDGKETVVFNCAQKTNVHVN